MDQGPQKTLGTLTLVAGLLATALFPHTAMGQAMPYPEKDCRALADDLAVAGPLPKPYRTEVQWFRDGDLGIKGRQCRISAGGVARKGKNAAARPGPDEIVLSVTQVLERHGFKGDRLLERYKRSGAAARAFALRKDRVTCWTNLVSADDTIFHAMPKDIPPNVNDLPRPPVWRLTVDCFLG